MLLLSTEVAAHKHQQEAHEAAFANTNADHRESVELLAAQAQAAHESLVKTHEKRLTALRATGLGKVVNRVRQRHKAAAWQAWAWRSMHVRVLRESLSYAIGRLRHWRLARAYARWMEERRLSLLLRRAGGRLCQRCVGHALGRWATVARRLQEERRDQEHAQALLCLRVELSSVAQQQAENAAETETEVAALTADFKAKRVAMQVALEATISTQTETHVESLAAEEASHVAMVAALKGELQQHQDSHTKELLAAQAEHAAAVVALQQQAHAQQEEHAAAIDQHQQVLSQALVQQESAVQSHAAAVVDAESRHAEAVQRHEESVTKLTSGFEAEHATMVATLQAQLEGQQQAHAVELATHQESHQEIMLEHAATASVRLRLVIEQC